MTSGAVGIAHSGPVTTISQSSNTAIINWQGFSIAPNETTQFIQPSCSAMTLNRVIGNAPSFILGNLKANGNIYIINANGILFGKNAQVNVGGLVATTSQISDASFLSGQKMQFTPGNNPNASIINNGNITIKNAGLAVLVSPNVINNGVIQANLGTVVLASGNHFTLDPYGDNLIAFDAGPMKTRGHVSNIGKILANGGMVIMTAQATTGMLQNVINMSGYIQAQSVSSQGGKVILLGYGNSKINLSGTIDVSGLGLNQIGGTIEASATQVQILSNSILNASGSAGGGNILIGSDVFHSMSNIAKINIFGAPSALPTADDVYVAPDSEIIADSLLSGNAGIVEVWGNVEDKFYGSISAQAKGLSGNGGNVETSGGILDTIGATVIASAKNGAAGLWYLDPTNFTVTNALAGGYSTSLQSGTNVYISATGNVIFSNTTTPITWGTAANFTASADTGLVGVGTGAITWSAGATIHPTGAGNVYFNYSPTTFETALSFSGLVSMGGTGTFTPTMQVNLAAAPTANTLNNSDAANFNTALTGGSSVLAYDNNSIALSNNTTPISWSTGNVLTIESFTGANINLSTSNAIESTGVGVTNLNAANNLNFTASNAINNMGSGAVNLTANGAVYFTNLDFGVISAAGTVTTTAPNLYINNNTSTITISNADASIINNALGASTNVSLTSIDNINFNNTTTPISWSTAANLTAIADSTEANLGSIGFAGVYSTTPSSTATLTSTGAGNLYFYYDSINAAPNEVATNFAGVVTTSGTGKLNATMKVFEPASTTINSTEAGKLTTALGAAATNVTLYGASNIIFGNGGSPITWANTDIFTVNAGTVSSGTAISFPTAGTIISMTGGGTTNLRADGPAGATTGTLANNTVSTTFTGTIVNTGSTVNVFYNPPSGFATPVSYAGLVSSGNAPTAYMLVYNNLASHDLSNVTTLSGNYALAQNLSSNLTTGPIGTTSPGFTGNFTGYDYYDNSGANYTISGLSFTTNNQYFGLFGYVSGTLQNISLINPNLSSTYNAFSGGAGSIAGYIVGTSSAAPAHLIGNFNVTNTSGNNALTSVVSGVVVGGLIGLIGNYSLLASGSTLSTTVTGGTFSVITNAGGTSSVGGLIGNISGSTVSATDFQASSMTNNDTVIAQNTSSASSSIGGIFGLFSKTGLTVATPMINNGIVETNTTHTLTITGVGGIGGLASGASTFTGAMINTGSIGGALGAGVVTLNDVGGLLGDVTAGSFTGNMTDSGNLFGTANTGGLIGLIAGAGTSISGAQSFQTTSAINVSGTQAVGGLIGQMGSNTVFSRTGTVSNAIGTTVTDTVGELGGLFGLITGTITTSADFTPTTLTNNAAVIQTAGTGGGASGEGGIIGQFNKTGLTIATNMTNNGAIESNATATVTVFDMGGIIGDLVVANTFTGTMSNTGNIGLALGTGAVTVSTAGGVIGAVNAGSFTGNMTDSGSVFGGVNTGGLIGFIGGVGTSISGTQNFQTTSAITVTGTNGVGGLIGQIGANTVFSPSGTVSNVVGTTVTGTTGNIGGLFGLVNGASNAGGGLTDFVIASLTNNATVIETAATAGNAGIGGIFGTFTKTGLTLATNMSNNGPIETNSNSAITIANMGGIAGYVNGTNTFSGSMTDAVSVGTGLGTGAITMNQVGGLFGSVTGVTFNAAGVAFNTTGGSVIGRTNVGGLIGSLTNSNFQVSDNVTHDNIYSQSAVSGSTNMGGLFGSVSNTASFAFDPGVAGGTLTNKGTFTITAAGSALGGIIGSYSVSGTSSYNMTNTASGSINTGSFSSFWIGGIIGSFGTGTLTGALSNSAALTTPHDTNVGGYIGNMGATAVLNSSVLTLNTQNIDGGDNSIGGIVGSLTGSLIGSGGYENTGNIGTLSTSNLLRNIGGIVGYFPSGTISASLTSSGNIGNPSTSSANYGVGGLIGFMNGGTLSGSYAFHTFGNPLIQGDRIVGGLIGEVQAGTATVHFQLSGSTSIYSMGSVVDTGSGGNIGGIFGVCSIVSPNFGIFSPSTTGTLTNNATVTVTTANTSDVGGIFGLYNVTGSTSSDSYTMVNNASGKILFSPNTQTGITKVGGIVGEFAGGTLTGSLTNYATIGDASSTASMVGGIAGLIDGGILNSSSLTSNSIHIYGSILLGGIVGSVTSGSLIGSGGYANSGDITGTGNAIGGLIGSATGTFSSDMTSSGNVSGSHTVGGLIGNASGATFNGVGTQFNTTAGSVTASSSDSGLVGGLIGSFVGNSVFVISDNATHNNIYSMSAVTGPSFVGGIFGLIQSGTANPGAGGGTLTNYGTVTVNGAGTWIGGIIGFFQAANTSAYNMMNKASATISSGAFVANDIGGIVGGLGTGGIFTGILENDATINTPNSSTVGGIAGAAYGTINNSMTNIGNITGTQYVGGLVGFDDGATLSGTMSSSGLLTAASTALGGVAGYMSATSSIALGGVTVTNTFSGTSDIGGVVGFTDGTDTFTGTFNNSGNAITITSGTNIGAVIGRATGSIGSITTNTALASNGTNVGAVVGFMDAGSSTGALSNLSSGVITGTGTNVGGDVGQTVVALSSGLSNAAAVSGSQYVGGLIGKDSGASISGTLTSSGALSASTSDLGGVIGYMHGGTINLSGVTVTNTFINTPLDIGGVVGYADGADTFSNTFTNAGNSITVGATGSNIGSVIGKFSGTLTGSIISTVNLSASNGTAVGMIGDVTTAINNPLTNSGNVTGKQYVGGLLGELNGSSLSGTLTSAGLLTATLNGLGGVAGYMTGTSSIALGSITVTNTFSGTSDIAGVVGYTDGADTFTGTFNNSGNALSITSGTNIGAMIGRSTGSIGSIITNTALSSNGANVGGVIGLMDTSSSAGALSNLSSGIITGTGTNVGGDVGQTVVSLSNTMSNSAAITGSTGVGGNIGFVSNGNIASVIGNTGTVTGTTSVGGNIGILGSANNTVQTGNITTLGSTFTGSGNVTGTTDVGGIVGTMVGNSVGSTTLAGSKTYGDGSLTPDILTLNSGGTNLGGIVGHMIDDSALVDGGTIVSNVEYISSGGTNIGVMIGLLEGTATLGGTFSSTSNYTTSVSGTNFGGLTGEILNASVGGNVTNATNIGGTAINVGGIAGLVQHSTLNGTFMNTANIAGGGIVGGLFGDATNSTLQGSYSNTGAVSGGQYVGGLLGELDGTSVSGTLTSSGPLSATLNGLGGVAGYMTGTSSIALDGITVTNTFTGTSDIAGVIGYTDGTDTFTGTFTNGGNALIINIGTNIGTIIGRANNATLSSIITSATMNSSNGMDVGGIAGNISNSNVSSNLTADGIVVVSGNSSVGGLVGYALNDTFTGINSFGGIVTGNLDTGGVVGTLNASSLMYAELNPFSGHGTVYGSNVTGGIAGNVINGASINQAVNTSNNTVVSVNSTGGIAGSVDATSSILNALFGGTVSATGNSVGGIAGVNNGMITDVLSVGKLITNGASAVGALVGTNNGTITASVYDVRFYGNGVGGVGAGNSGGTASLVSALLAGPSFYTAMGWDFTNIWNTSPGNYPVLRFCPSCSVRLLPAINLHTFYSQLNNQWTNDQYQNLPSNDEDLIMVMVAKVAERSLLTSPVIPTQLSNTFVLTKTVFSEISDAFFSITSDFAKIVNSYSAIMVLLISWIILALAMLSKKKD